jgi:hypothetical protein
MVVKWAGVAVAAAVKFFNHRRAATDFRWRPFVFPSSASSFVFSSRKVVDEYKS